jgi:hypothetical protein
MTPLDSYRSLLELSQEMLALAKEQAWDALLTAERRRAAHLASIPAHLPSRNTPEATAIGDLIRQIQTCDREVLEYVQPWMADAGKLLARLAAKP